MGLEDLKRSVHYEIGDLTLDVGQCRLTRAEQPLALTKRRRLATKTRALRQLIGPCYGKTRAAHSQVFDLKAFLSLGTGLAIYRAWQHFSPCFLSLIACAAGCC
jgi:hypothetical protein